MITKHWGHWVDSDQPVGGVVQLGGVAAINDEVCDHAVANLTEIGALAEYIREKTAEHERDYWASAADFAPDPIISPEMIAEWEAAFYEDTSDLGPCDYLIGDWVRGEDGLYSPDPAGEYSAIVSYDSMTAQIVRSNWVSRGALCSPCYPGQVDLDTPGDWLGYDFPPELYGELRRNPNPIARLDQPRFTITIQVMEAGINGVLAPLEWEAITYQALRSDLQSVKQVRDLIADYGAKIWEAGE